MIGPDRRLCPRCASAQNGRGGHHPRVPDAVQRATLLRRAGTHNLRYTISNNARRRPLQVQVTHGRPFFVYILENKRNGTLYIGVTNNLARRIAEHKAKLVPGFTRKYGVDLLVYFEAFDSVLEARAREHAMKRWRRAWKIELIEKLNPDWRDLANELNA
ncbi:GIY-YIG nuclease family protein [Bradyrhizobium sp. AUGA SZCCT0160]|nr:GIY-YIG nuclease family protein [Bradyrhizobium sp. AUGA SZCCT0160]